MNNCSAGLEISCILWNMKVHYQLCRSLLLAPELDECSPCPPFLFLRYILILRGKELFLTKDPFFYIVLVSEVI
jgi:hypothetical protein